MISARSMLHSCLTCSALALFLLTSCGNAPASDKAVQVTDTPATSQPLTKLNSLHWLVGKWQNAKPEGIIFEYWELADGGSLKGSSGFIKGKDTAVGETISIEQQGTDILYIPTVKDQNSGQPVVFRLVAATGDSFVFENPAHDFPQKITYRMLSATELAATISGSVNGNERSEVFQFTKAE